MTQTVYDEARKVAHQTDHDGRPLCGKTVLGADDWTAVLAAVAMPCPSCRRAAAMMERKAA
jgi:hypothetical protein